MREVTLEVGRAPTPQAIAQTVDGGYVVAGTVWVPWATRVDANGNVIWRYELPPTNSSAPNKLRGQYHGAAVLPDDSVILCGEMEMPPESGQKYGGVAGILTHLDKAGNVLSHQTIYPNGDKNFVLSRLFKCMRWGDGIAITGLVRRFLPGSGNHYEQEDSTWILALNSKGEVGWEKLLPNTSGGRGTILTNQDLLLLVGNRLEGGKMSGRFFWFDKNGNLKSQSGDQEMAGFIKSTAAEPSVHLLFDTIEHPVAIKTLNEQGGDLGVIQGQVIPFTAHQAYMLPDRPLILFGTDYGPSGKGSPAAAIRWYSADLKEQETLVFKPHSSCCVNDAVFTGRPGGFVTARRVDHISQQDQRQAVVLAFIQIK